MSATCQFLLRQLVLPAKDTDVFAEIGYDVLLHGIYLGVNTFD